MRKLRLLAVVIALAAAAAAQGPAKTTVSDTLYDPAGGLATGSITVSAPFEFTSADGFVVYQGGVAAGTITNGALSIALVPNAGSTPSGSYYQVRIRTAFGSYTETWIVPSSGTAVKLSAVRALLPPTPSYVFAFSQINPPVGCVPNQFIEWSGTSWSCNTMGGISNPMTAANDLIVGGTNGAPLRLATGTTSQFFAGGSVWRAIAAGDLPASISANTTGNAATATALAAVPAQCPSAQYSTGIAASGAANCAQIGFGQLSGVPAIVNSFSGRAGAVSPASGDYTAAQVTNAFDVTKANTLTAVAAPLAPATGFGASWFDSTNLLPEAKNASGTLFLMPSPLAAVAHQWLTSLGPAGQFTAAQPAFGDISGLVGPGQLPDPTASTLGGVESAAAVNHEWISSISTLGVPNLSQPSFADISGLLGDPQLPADAAKFTGTITPADCAKWSSSGVLADAGAACGSGSGGVPSASADSIPYWAVTGTTLAALAPPTTNGHWFVSYGVTGGVAVAPTIEQAGITAGTVGGATTSYVFTASDEGNVVVHDKAATGTVNPATLPTPTTLGNPDFDTMWCNDSPQTDVIVPTTFTIAIGNGSPGPTASIASGECGRIIVDPAHPTSQWILIPSFTTNGTGSSAFSALTGGTNTTAAMLVGSGASLGPTGTGTVNANQLQGVTVSSTAPTTNQVLAYNGTQWAPAAAGAAAVNFFTPRDRTWQALIVNNGHNRIDEIGFANTTTGTLTYGLSNIDAKANSFATIATGTVASTKDGVSSSGNVQKLAIPGLAYSFQAIVGINTAASVNSWVALSSDQSVADLAGNVDPGAAATTVVGFRFFSATDTSGHWQCYISAGSAGEVIDSGVAVDTTNLQTFDIFATAGGAITFDINGVSVCGSPVTPTAGHVPSLSMAPLWAIANTTTTSVTGSIAKLYVGAQ